MGKTATLHVTLHGKTTDRPLPEPMAVEVSPGLRLAVELGTTGAEPGEHIPTTLIWYPADDFTPIDLALRWRRATDDAAIASAPLPMPPDLPMATWPTRDWFRQVTALPIPAELPPGEYVLVIEPVAGAPVAERVVRRPVTVTPSSRSFTAPPLAQPLEVSLFEAAERVTPQLQLLGLRDALPSTIEPSQPLTVTLVWQAPTGQTAPAYDYTISVQLLEGDGNPIAQSDLLLTDGSSSWLPGQVVTQPVTLAPPATAGDYRLIVVIYDPARDGLPRLITAAEADFVDLATLRVVR
jgi:hypothetical protein